MIAIKKCREIVCKKIEKINEECIKVIAEIKGESWILYTVYMRGKREEIWSKIRDDIERNPGQRVMIGGDFNSRTGREGGRRVGREEEEERERE